MECSKLYMNYLKCRLQYLARFLWNKYFPLEDSFAHRTLANGAQADEVRMVTSAVTCVRKSDDSALSQKYRFKDSRVYLYFE